MGSTELRSFAGVTGDVTLPTPALFDAAHPAGRWVAAQRDLLVKEKEATRQRDLLNAERRELPMVEVTKAYELEGAGREAGALEAHAGVGRPLVLLG